MKDSRSRSPRRSSRSRRNTKIDPRLTHDLEETQKLRLQLVDNIMANVHRSEAAVKAYNSARGTRKKWAPKWNDGSGRPSPGGHAPHKPRRKNGRKSPRRTPGGISLREYREIAAISRTNIKHRLRDIAEVDMIDKQSISQYNRNIKEAETRSLSIYKIGGPGGGQAPQTPRGG